MSFVTPAANPAIPTYRVMDSEGVIVDKSRGPPDVTDEEVITWYKNMLCGKKIHNLGSSLDVTLLADERTYV